MMRPNWVEKQIYPATYQYSYTFKWKTAAQITSERDVNVGTLSTNSEWFNGYECVIKKDIPNLANARKITISGNVVWQGGNATAIQLGVGKGSWWGDASSIFELHWSWFSGIKVKYYDGTNHYWTVIWNATNATYNPTITIDLENKLITWVLSWFSNSTLTLTDERVSNIRTFTYLRCYVSDASWAISDVKITIE
jgi:hypothetical protein